MTQFTSQLKPDLVYADFQHEPDTDQVFALVHERCIQRRILVATAESCTGGLIAGQLTERPGSSAFFYGAWVVYSNHAKHSMLEVSPYDIRDFGAVSEEVAKAMLVGVLNTSPANHAISVTGIAGPEGGSEKKPVGTVWIGAAFRDSEKKARGIVRLFQFHGTRKEIRQSSVRASGLLILELMALEDIPIDTIPMLE